MVRRFAYALLQYAEGLVSRRAYNTLVSACSTAQVCCVLYRSARVHLTLFVGVACVRVLQDENSISLQWELLETHLTVTWWLKKLYERVRFVMRATCVCTLAHDVAPLRTLTLIEQ